MLLHLAEQCGVNVTYRGENQNLTLFVVPRGRSILIGRDWLVNLKVDLNELSNMCSLSLLDGKKLFNDFPDEFSEKPGCFKQLNPKIPSKEINVKPIFHRSRPQEEVTAVESSGWSSPVVSDIKANGKVRPCSKNVIEDGLSGLPLRATSENINRNNPPKAELHIRRKLCTRIDSCLVSKGYSSQSSDVEERVKKNMDKRKKNFRCNRQVDFFVGESVLVKKYEGKKKQVGLWKNCF
uniref:Uncharacterized protein n=1 Tax=Cacopsylla melanoneura TaxID=428564 RepID=A0A8D8YE86_9HEMI